jgi:hypothetical protein
MAMTMTGPNGFRACFTELQFEILIEGYKALGDGVDGTTQYVT